MNRCSRVIWSQSSGQQVAPERSSDLRMTSVCCMQRSKRFVGIQTAVPASLLLLQSLLHPTSPNDPARVPSRIRSLTTVRTTHKRAWTNFAEIFSPLARLELFDM